jgi:hypothetical protein
MNRELEPATDKQLALIRDLGLIAPHRCSVAQASELIGRTQIIRHFAIFVARQAWSVDVSDRDLRPVIGAVMQKPAISDDVQEIMDAYTQAAFTAEAAQGKAAGTSAPLEPSIFMDLHEDGTFTFVKSLLEKHLPDVKAQHDNRPLSAPPTAKVFLASDSGILQSVRVWVDGILKR